jgi:hypothetical protein
MVPLSLLNCISPFASNQFWKAVATFLTTPALMNVFGRHDEIKQFEHGL